MAATLAQLRDEILSVRKPVDPEYAAKQLHDIPAFEVIQNRKDWLCREAIGQVVLHVGASGPLHTALCAAALTVYGLDRDAGPNIVGMDLDDISGVIPVYRDVTLIIAGEVLEHLSNPGWFLRRLKASYRCPLIVTVPNAHASVSAKWISKGIENVNRDHVAWYSWKTLDTLLTRTGYRVRQYAWYHGQPRTAEGLIAVTEVS